MHRIRLVDVPPFLKGRQICDLLLPFLHTKSLPISVYSKRTECAPSEDLFPFRVDAYSEVRQKKFVRVASPKSVPVPTNFTTGGIICQVAVVRAFLHTLGTRSLINFQYASIIV